MKEPERLIGFVNYDDAEIAFEFDADDFTLHLYPPKELWKKYVRPFYVFSKHQIDFTKHEWIPENRIQGKTTTQTQTKTNSDSIYLHCYCSFLYIISMVR